MTSEPKDNSAQSIEISLRIQAGLDLVKQNRITDATAHFKCLTQEHPQNANIAMLYGDCLVNEGQNDQAILQYKGALELGLDNHDIHLRLGDLLFRSDKLRDAASHLSRAAQHNPKAIQTKIYLAHALERTNQTDLVANVIEDVLAISPSHIEANRIAATLKRRAGDIQGGIDLLTNLSLENVPASEKARCLFELGTLYDRSGRSREAYDTFDRANIVLKAKSSQNRNSKEPYDNFLAYEQNAINRLEKAESARAAKDAATGTPTFLVGFPRSGTTLLHQILDAHPDTLVMDERECLSAAHQTLISNEQRVGETESHGPESLNSIRDSYFKCVEAQDLKIDQKRFIDKLPLNIVSARAIHTLFPDAKIIFAMRHPCDVCLSNFMQMYSLNAAMTHLTTLEDTVAFYDRVMRLWADAQAKLPLTVIPVKYEDIVRDFEAKIRKALEALSLSWDDAVLNYADHAKTGQGIRTPSYQDVTLPIFDRSLYRWHRYKEQFEPFKTTLLPHVESLGYSWDGQADA